MKKGSTVVESIVSLSILLIALTLSVQISIISSKSIILRKNKEKANRVAYAIENEIKYNISFSDLKERLEQGNLSYKYTDNILEKLLDTSLFYLESGNGILVKKIRINSTEVNYEIYTLKIEILDSGGGVLTEREFIKSYWMDI
ncbi:prepilin-type cleavage/methylation domain-containing protein [Clostridium nigeriense]|uniref:prepilin-type cleavage/methylation domain-containing protein n=1 Tax=Clostridium nigeriense TaxID=1805470 RepID=UPI00082BED3F|nr:prepilin-type cleavage/methylation domain-containing protein [Clostridium nigeriense]